MNIEQLKDLHNANTKNVHKAFSAYSSKQNFKTESDLFVYIDAYNITARKLKLLEIDKVRDMSSLVYPKISAIYTQKA